MIEMLGATDQFVMELPWLAGLMHRLFGTSVKPCADHQLKAQSPVRFSHTPFGTRSYYLAGSGSPTVIFESGLGDGKEVWAPVFNALSRKTRVLAYDRAGYGQSDKSSWTRDGFQIVHELRALLRTENIAPPYVLVGHSLGGTLVKLFARTYPDEVAGVVLVDARHADFVGRCRKMGLLRLLYEPPLPLFLLGRSAMRSELLAAPATMEQARSTGTFPNVPLRVLTHRRRFLYQTRGLALAWADCQSSLAGMSAQGLLRICDQSGHHVHRDRPDLVIRAILSVMASLPLPFELADPHRLMPS
ncbi:MAG TPA: alpha/beta fold hydrolase [Rhodoferax sp.]|nr:alpha/beta fold hydrolase [Rhodoferax sp.]